MPTSCAPNKLTPLLAKGVSSLIPPLGNPAAVATVLDTVWLLGTCPRPAPVPDTDYVGVFCTLTALDSVAELLAFAAAVAVLVSGTGGVGGASGMEVATVAGVVVLLANAA